jgi:hypothetical protein
MAKIYVDQDELYPYYHLYYNSPFHCSEGEKEIPQDLIDRYIDIQKRFEDVWDELDLLLHPEE